VSADPNGDQAREIRAALRKLTNQVLFLGELGILAVSAAVAVAVAVGVLVFVDHPHDKMSVAFAVAIGLFVGWSNHFSLTAIFKRRGA
jgi:hypothetical protein